jgi:hypothetical protein
MKYRSKFIARIVISIALLTVFLGGTATAQALPAGSYSALCVNNQLIDSPNDAPNLVGCIYLDTTINTQPTNPSANSSPSFTFAASTVGVGAAKVGPYSPLPTPTFECSMDNVTFTACTSGQTFGPLPDGSHNFRVRSVISDYGEYDTTPASYTWMIDTTAPNTTINTNPSDPAPTSDAVFTFSGNDGAGVGVASYECSLDGSAFSACTSGTNFGPLGDGSHTFQVRAKDTLGNTDASPASYTWTTDVYDPPIFADVPFSYWANYWIEILYNDGITGGCATDPHLIYCPDAPVTRAEMAIFILRSEHGGAYTPPPATGMVFTDVPLGSFADAWIEQLATEGITGGCTLDGTQYCPDKPITRAEMAIFLLRGEHGSAYTPPPAMGTVFVDVTLGSFADAWIEQLAREKIAAGCGGGNYCPGNPVTRAEMAVFLVETFNLP